MDESWNAGKTIYRKGQWVTFNELGWEQIGNVLNEQELEECKQSGNAFWEVLEGNENYTPPYHQRYNPQDLKVINVQGRKSINSSIKVRLATEEETKAAQLRRLFA